MTPTSRLTLLLCISAAMLSACSVGPDYRQPSAAVPLTFKEAAGWKIAEPQDSAPRGDWWQMFCDDELNRLEEQVAVNNQNIKAAEASFRQAQAIVAQARSGYFPTVTASADSTRSRQSTLNGVANRYNASLSASWELDVWGRIRRTVEANEANAAASAGDLAAAQLAAQAELATNYLSLRVADEQKRYLQETVQAYARSLQMTQDLYTTGVQSRSDYLQAKVQLEGARAQLVDVDVQRSAYEHAIAVLIGKSPAEFSILPNYAVPSTPRPPVALPATVLQRRPDIAAAERRVAAANANIGVAEAAFYPDVSLSASAGFASSALAEWFTAPARVWSVGPSLAQTLFDAGLRKAQTQEAIAAYDLTVATYRQTVLAAFQEVEDNLSGLSALQEEQTIRNTAVEDARAATEVLTNQYKAGITSYLNVASAQTTELSNALSALAVKKQRLNATVALIKALGGKWDIAVTEDAAAPAQAVKDTLQLKAPSAAQPASAVPAAAAPQKL